MPSTVAMLFMTKTLGMMGRISVVDVGAVVDGEDVGEGDMDVGVEGVGVVIMVAARTKLLLVLVRAPPTTSSSFRA